MLLTTCANAQAAHQVFLDEVRRLDEANADDETFSPGVSAEEDGKRTVAKTRCANHGEFFASAAHLYRTDMRAFGEPQHEYAYGSLAMLVRDYLDQQAA
jgi:hypothetical protein